MCTFRLSDPGELVDHVGAVDAAGVQLQRRPPRGLLRRRDERKEEVAHGNTASHLHVVRWRKGNRAKERDWQEIRKLVKSNPLLRFERR